MINFCDALSTLYDYLKIRNSEKVYLVYRFLFSTSVTVPQFKLVALKVLKQQM